MRRSANNRLLSNKRQTHIKSLVEMARGGHKTPLVAVEEVVQAKLLEERNLHAREMKLKIKGFLGPLPSPFKDPI